MLADIDAFVSAITSAAKRDAERWQNSNVRTNGDMSGRKKEFLNLLNWRIDWLCSQWGEGDSTPITDDVPTVLSEPAPATIRLVDGQLLIQRDGHTFTITGQPVE